jgi:hypothetical protein
MRTQAAELRVLMQGRIPSIHAIDPGLPVPVGQGPVRSATFASVPGSGTLQYKVVLANDVQPELVPDVELILFDRRGFQVKTIAIRPGTGGRTRRSLMLLQGDVRTVQNEITISPWVEPAHFYVRVDGAPLFESEGAEPLPAPKGEAETPAVPDVVDPVGTP